MRVLLASLVLAAVNLPPDPGLPAPTFPSEVVDVEGRDISAKALTRGRILVVVTLKAPSCPVCREQLVRLKKILPQLDRERVTFLVLSPGPADEINAIKERTGFPYPFIEDQGLAIAKRLELNLGDSEIMPCIFILDEQLRIRWIQSGRSGWYFGDEELMREIGLQNWI